MGVGEGDGEGEGEGDGEACGNASPGCADEPLGRGNKTTLNNHIEAQKAKAILLKCFMLFVLLCGLISSSKRQVLVSVLR